MKGEAPTPGQFKIVDEYPHGFQNKRGCNCQLAIKINNKIPFDWKPYTIKEIPVNDKAVKVGIYRGCTHRISNLVLRKNRTIPGFDEAESIMRVN